MVTSSIPPVGVTDDTARDLVNQMARLARALEARNAREKLKEQSESSEARFARIEPSYTPDTINPPRMPRNLSWHEKVREKKVSLPAATGWSLLGYVVIEIGQALISGRIHLW